MNRSIRTAALSLFTLGALLQAAPALADSGKITGKVSATPAKYLADTVVYLKEVKGTFTKKTVTMDQKGMKFTPRLLTITAGDSVTYTNHDDVDHNVMSPDNGGYTLGAIKGGASGTHDFPKAGIFTQLCNIHPEMLAYIFVGQNPYSAAVDANGAFTLSDVPPGTYELAVWNPKLKTADQKVTVPAAGGEVQVNLEIKR
jgi:plastocyanin